MSRHTIDGGGDRSVSPQYVITGTVGQPDAHGLLVGPTYRLGGGFWPVLPKDALFLDGFEEPL